MADPIGTPAPRAGARSRKVTSKRGGQVTPEGTQPRFTGGRRGQYPKGSEPKPENTKWRKPGDPQGNTQKSNVVPPVVVGPSGESKSLDNPVK